MKCIVDFPRQRTYLTRARVRHGSVHLGRNESARLVVALLVGRVTTGGEIEIARDVVVSLLALSTEALLVAGARISHIVGIGAAFCGIRCSPERACAAGARADKAIRDVRGAIVVGTATVHRPRTAT